MYDLDTARSYSQISECFENYFPKYRACFEIIFPSIPRLFRNYIPNYWAYVEIIFPNTGLVSSLYSQIPDLFSSRLAISINDGTTAHFNPFSSSFLLAATG